MRMQRSCQARVARSPLDRPSSVAPRRLVPAELPRARDARASAHASGRRRIVDEPLDRRGQLVGIVGIDEQPGVAEHFGQRAAIGGDDRHAERSSPRAPECRSLPRTTAAPAAARLRTARRRRADRRSRCAGRCPASGGRRDPLEPRPRLPRSPGRPARAPAHRARRAPRAARTRRAARRRSCAARACRGTARSRRRAAASRAASSPARRASRPRCDRRGTLEAPLDFAGRERARRR